MQLASTKYPESHLHSILKMDYAMLQIFIVLSHYSGLFLPTSYLGVNIKTWELCLFFAPITAQCDSDIL